MPAVSDPGARLVAGAREAGHAVEVVPGPSAVTAAVALAGVEAPGFLFGGFLLSRARGARRVGLERLLRAAAAADLPLVLYEAPTRVAALLRDLAELVPDARVAVGRELTKLHEEVRVGAASELAADPPVARGEFTVVIAGLVASDAVAAERFDAAGLARMALGQGLSERGTIELLRAAGLPRREAYRVAREVAGAADPAAGQ